MTKKFCPYLCSILSTLILMVGCGKKVEEEKKDKPDRITNPQKPDIEIELEKQELFCGADRACPEYITKIAFVHGDKLKFCTGFLVSADVVATASSCLPENLRTPEASCAKSAHLFFAKAGDKPVREACEKVLLASKIEGKEPFLWRNDIAYLKLAKKGTRRTTSFPHYRLGMNDQDKFYTWTVDQIDEHQGIIRRSDDCYAVHNSYFNPLSTNQNSPVITMSGCKYSDGNSGSPILDFRNRVRGVVSGKVIKTELDEVETMRILERPLKPILFASNANCLPILDEDDASDTECSKQLDLKLHRTAQTNMVDESKLFQTTLKNYESGANSTTMYINFLVKYALEGEYHRISFEPKCFKNVSSWINTFPGNPKSFQFRNMLPDVRIRKSMTEYSRINVREFNDGSLKAIYEFNPRVLRSVPQNGGLRNARIHVWGDVPSNSYDNVTECR